MINQQFNKKLILSSVFPDEDEMFYHNKVFRLIHSWMRENEKRVQFGISSNRHSLYLYGSETLLNEVLDLHEVKMLFYRRIYTHTIEDAEKSEPVLVRVNHFDPKKKARAQYDYLKKKHGEIDPVLAGDKVTLQGMVAYYEALYQKQREKNDKNALYFIANKDGHKISIYAQRAYADPALCKPNSYGLSGRQLLQ